MGRIAPSPARRKATIALLKARGDTPAERREATATGASLIRPEPRSRGASVVRRKAIEFALSVMPAIEALRREGKTSLNALARGLNEAGLSTASGKAWSAASVRALIRCAERAGVA